MLGARRLSALLDELQHVGWLVPGFAHSELGLDVLDKAERRYELCVAVPPAPVVGTARDRLLTHLERCRFLTIVDKVVKEGPPIVTLDIDFVCVPTAPSSRRASTAASRTDASLPPLCSWITHALTASHYRCVSHLGQPSSLSGCVR